MPPRAPPDISCPHTLLAPPSVLPRNLPFEMPHLFHALHRMGSRRSRREIARLAPVQLKSGVNAKCSLKCVFLEREPLGPGNDINDWK